MFRHGFFEHDNDCQGFLTSKKCVQTCLCRDGCPHLARKQKLENKGVCTERCVDLRLRFRRAVRNTELLRLVGSAQVGFHSKALASSRDHREWWSGLSRCDVPPTSLQLLVLQTLKEGLFPELDSESPDEDNITGPDQEQTNKQKKQANARPSFQEKVNRQVDGQATKKNKQLNEPSGRTFYGKPD